MTPMPRYVIVSPVKDEERYVELTLRSVIRQTVKPVLWVVVDDGSKDATAEIVRRYAIRHPFIRLMSGRTAGARQTGSAEAYAFKRGYASLGAEDYDFIVKLDGDLSFEPEYFEKLLGRFLTDERLGIASGIYLDMDKSGSWTPVRMPSYHAFGACKVVRRSCFEEIDGFLTTPGWDTVDEIRALHRGWTTRHFTDLEAKHHKGEGSGMGLLTTSLMHGEIYYLTGGDPLFLVFKILSRITATPLVLNAMALAAGYLTAMIKRKPRLVTEPEARRYRQMLRQRLWGRAMNPSALSPLGSGR
jgi:biofilm PGA synthesis N-glycosyltransferase PgaC